MTGDIILDCVNFVGVGAHDNPIFQVIGKKCGVCDAYKRAFGDARPYKYEPNFANNVGNGLCAIPILRRSVQHIFNEDAIAGGGVVDQHMGHRADEFAVLDDGATGHADVK